MSGYILFSQLGQWCCGRECSGSLYSLWSWRFARAKWIKSCAIQEREEISQQFAITKCTAGT